MDILKKILNKIKKTKNSFNLKRYKQAEEGVLNKRIQEDEINEMVNWVIENIGKPNPSQYNSNWVSPEYQNIFLNIINKYKVPVISIKQYINRNLGNPNPEPIDPSWNTDEFRQLFMRVAATMAFGNIQVEKSIEDLMSNTNIKQQPIEEEISQPKEQLRNQEVLNNFYKNPEVENRLKAIKGMLSRGGRNQEKANESVNDAVLEIIGGMSEEGSTQKPQFINFFVRNPNFLPDNIKNTSEFNSIINMTGDEKEKKLFLSNFLLNQNNQIDIISQMDNLILNKDKDFLNSIINEISNNAKYKMFPKQTTNLNAFKKKISNYLVNNIIKGYVQRGNEISDAFKKNIKNDIDEKLDIPQDEYFVIQTARNIAENYGIPDEEIYGHMEKMLNKKLKREKGRLGELSRTTSLNISPEEGTPDIGSLVTEEQLKEKNIQKDLSPEEKEQIKEKGLKGLVSEKEIIYPQIKALGTQIADNLLNFSAEEYKKFDNKNRTNEDYKKMEVRNRTDGEQLKLYINLLDRNINKVISLDNPDFKVKKDKEGNEYALFSIPKEESYGKRKSMIRVPLDDPEKRVKEMRLDSIVDSETLMKSFSDLGILKQKIKNELKVRSINGVAIVLASEISNYLNQFKKKGEPLSTEQDISDFIKLTDEQSEKNIKYLQRDFAVKDFQQNKDKYESIAKKVETLHNMKQEELEGNNVYKYVDNLGVERYYMTRNGDDKTWDKNPEKKYIEFYMDFYPDLQKLQGYVRHNQIRPQFFAKSNFLKESLEFADQYDPKVFQYFFNFLKFGKDVTESTKTMPYSRTIDYYRLRNETISEELLNKIVENKTHTFSKLKDKAEKEGDIGKVESYKEQIESLPDKIKKLVSDHNKNLKQQKKKEANSYYFMLKTSYINTVEKLNNLYNLKKQFSNIKIASKNIQYVDMLISKITNEFKEFTNKFDI